jgi:hypothetical protein
MTVQNRQQHQRVWLHTRQFFTAMPLGGFPAPDICPWGAKSSNAHKARFQRFFNPWVPNR